MKITQTRKLVQGFGLAIATLLFATSAAANPLQEGHGDHDHGDHGHGEHAKKEVKTPAKKKAGTSGLYLLSMDMVTGKTLGPIDKQIKIDHEGRELRFSSEKSVGKFRKDPAKYIALIDAAIIKQQLPFYPLLTCPVSGEELGGMGDPVDIVYNNRLVRFCCKGCKPKFYKAPAAFMAKLDAAVIKQQTAKYPVNTCLVSGEELGGMGDVIDVVVGNRLVRICCKMCKGDLKKDPVKYLAELDKAAAKKEK